ncbi:hypothetical protein GCM10027589_38380 [Actinocorallia lasiicapitis]
MQHKRKTLGVIFSLIAMSFVTATATATPALADVGAYGNIQNNLPGSYPVKIARFGVGGSHYCGTANAGSFTCEEWWLPSGRSDSWLKGYWFDTDGFKVENVDYYYVSGYGWVPGNTWYKISDYHEVTCYMSSGNARCDVTL